MAVYACQSSASLTHIWARLAKCSLDCGVAAVSASRTRLRRKFGAIALRTILLGTGAALAGAGCKASRKSTTFRASPSAALDNQNCGPEALDHPGHRRTAIPSLKIQAWRPAHCTAVATQFYAIYAKPSQPQLILRSPSPGGDELLRRAWQAADTKAREIGWINGAATRLMLVCVKVVTP